MKVLLKILKVLAMIVAFLACMIPAIFAMSYVLTDFSKEALLKTIEMIPAENIPFLVIPIILLSVGVGVWILKKLIEESVYEEQRVYHLKPWN